MGQYLQGAVMGFREGLEAALIITIMLRYLGRTGQHGLKRHVGRGAALGVLISVVLGAGLALITQHLGNSDRVAKAWESAASMAALALVTMFIVWMIRHGQNMAGEVRRQVDSHLSALGISLVAAAMVAREGAEIAVFTFAGQYSLGSIATGVAVSLTLAVLIYYSLVRVNLRVLFSITLGYLILQAGFLLGYSIHEGLSVLKDLGQLAATSPLLVKVYDLSSTGLNHKSSPLGIALYVLFGWYSKPEWVQFIAQYAYTFGMFALWSRTRRTNE